MQSKNNSLSSKFTLKLSNEFLWIILVQIVIFGSICLDSIGLCIPLFREISGFFYLLFVPGILLLKIFEFKTFSMSETILYSVGLSILTLMALGLLINFVYPLFGISKPISLEPLSLSLGLVTLFLTLLSYNKSDEQYSKIFLKIPSILSPQSLALFLIPILIIAGTYLVNFYQNKELLFFLIAAISLIPLIVISTVNKQQKILYPLLVFIISISLLLHNSLISDYLWGWDIQIEHYLSNLVLIHGIWTSLNNNVNAMLSIVLLAPIFSIICDLNLILVYKIIYPFIFSLVPVGLYKIFEKQTNEQIAFLAVFFFMSFLGFYTEMLAVARQQIAEFFLVLITLSMLNRDLPKNKKSFFFIVFSMGLSISHYGLSYLFMGSLLFAWLITYPQIKMQYFTSNITFRLILIYISFSLCWYLYVSNSSVFSTIVTIGSHISNSLSTDFLNPSVVEGASIILTKKEMFVTEVTKYLHILTQFFISIGVLTLILRKNRNMQFTIEYSAFVYSSFLLNIAGLTIPFFSSSLNASRLYQITLLFLAPFCILGADTILRSVYNFFRFNLDLKSSLSIISLFLTIYLLFNSGFIHSLTSESFASISLDNSADFPIFTEPEVYTMTWLKNTKETGIMVYSDSYRSLLILSILGQGNPVLKTNDQELIILPENRKYLFLGKENTVNKKILVKTYDKKTINLEYNNSDISNKLFASELIYTSGDSEIYYLKNNMNITINEK